MRSVVSWARRRRSSTADLPAAAPRRAVWLIGAATAFSLLGDQTLYSTLPVFFEDLGLRPIEVGIILSANRWIRLGTNELAHRLQGVGDDRWFFVGAVTVGAAMTAVYAATPGFVVFVLARLVWGLCWSFIRHLGVLSVMAVTAGERAGHAAGRLGGISRAGSVGGLFGGALLVDRFGFGPALLILAGISAVAIPLAWAGFAPVVARQPTETTPDGGRHLVAGVLGFAHGMVGPGLVMATLGVVLDEQLGAGGRLSAASLTGAILAARFVLESGAAARLGSISDRLGVRITGTAAFCLGALALTIAALSSSLVLLIVAVLTFFTSGTALSAALTGFTGRQGSRSLARYVTANDMGAASGPIIGWVALDLFQQRTIGLGIGAAIYAIAAVVAYRALERRSGRPPGPGRAGALSSDQTEREDPRGQVDGRLGIEQHAEADPIDQQAGNDRSGRDADRLAGGHQADDPAEGLGRGGGLHGGEQSNGERGTG